MSPNGGRPTRGAGEQGERDGSVRTYRGKKLADLLPQIREELGPDAIILREREGLVGGINGFFAQRFIEVEARAGSPSIDIRDDDEIGDELLRLAPPFPTEPAPPAAYGFAAPGELHPGSELEARLREDAGEFARGLDAGATDAPPAPGAPGPVREAAYEPELGPAAGLAAPAPGPVATPAPAPAPAPRHRASRKPTPKLFSGSREEVEREAERFGRFLDAAAEAEQARAQAAAEAELARQREAAAEDAARQLEREQAIADDAARRREHERERERAAARAAEAELRAEELAEAERKRAAAAARRRERAAAKRAEAALAAAAAAAAAAAQSEPEASGSPDASSPGPQAPAEAGAKAGAKTAVKATTKAVTKTGGKTARSPRRSAANAASEAPGAVKSPAPPAVAVPDPAQGPEDLHAPQDVWAPAPDLPAIPTAAPAGPVTAALPSPAPVTLERGKRSRRRVSSRRARPKGRPLDVPTAAAVAADLTATGLDEMWVQRLIVEGAAHYAPFTGGDLRRATRRALERCLPPPPGLPPGGARVALVGPGGAGKTRLTAALAGVYGAASTMPIAVVSLAGKDQGRSLSALLEPHGIHASTHASPEHAAAAAREASEDGIVVIDTPPLAVADPEATDALVAALAATDADVVLLVVPAGLGVPAARRLIEAAAPLRPAGVAITHADETEAIGEVVQAAAEAGLPISLLVPGDDGPLDAMTPASLAERLLP